MRFFEAKVLVPLDGAGKSKRLRWEASLLHLYSGFHKGASVQGQTRHWGKEYMVPYHIALATSDTFDVAQKIGPLARAVKDIFGEEAVYIAVTELAAPFIH